MCKIHDFEDFIVYNLAVMVYSGIFNSILAPYDEYFSNIMLARFLQDLTSILEILQDFCKTDSRSQKMLQDRFFEILD